MRSSDFRAPGRHGDSPAACCSVRSLGRAWRYTEESRSDAGSLVIRPLGERWRRGGDGGAATEGLVETGTVLVVSQTRFVVGEEDLAGCELDFEATMPLVERLGLVM